MPGQSDTHLSGQVEFAHGGRLVPPVADQLHSRTDAVPAPSRPVPSARAATASPMRNQFVSDLGHPEVLVVEI